MSIGRKYTPHWHGLDSWNLSTEDHAPRSSTTYIPRYVYWTDVNRSTLERAGLDGSGRTVLISEGVRWPNGLWIDAPARRIYIADAHTNEVFHVNYNGTDKKVGTAQGLHGRNVPCIYLGFCYNCQSVPVIGFIACFFTLNFCTFSIFFFIFLVF